MTATHRTLARRECCDQLPLLGVRGFLGPYYTDITSFFTESQCIRSGLVLYETPSAHDEARTASCQHKILCSLPYAASIAENLTGVSTQRRLIDVVLLVDSSPSQKRKMRPQDPADCEVDLFSTPSQRNSSDSMSPVLGCHVEAVSDMYPSVKLYES
ncbi:hypothetical protein GQ600_19202 [Phytophthora cactorum]|nr:hypothetical protein GQ600_19202 [Phytophthora cactorum]